MSNDFPTVARIYFNEIFGTLGTTREFYRDFRRSITILNDVSAVETTPNQIDDGRHLCSLRGPPASVYRRARI
jgi:hypothetical protein